MALSKAQAGQSVELLFSEIRQPADHAHQTLTLDPHLIHRRSTQQRLRT
jgi:DNA-binding LacI/PurR family transcriptional regulator